MERGLRVFYKGAEKTNEMNNINNTKPVKSSTRRRISLLNSGRPPRDDAMREATQCKGSSEDGILVGESPSQEGMTSVHPVYP